MCNTRCLCGNTFEDIVDEAVKNGLLEIPVLGWLYNVLDGGNPFEDIIDKAFDEDTRVRMDM